MERQEKAHPQLENPDHVLAELAVRELKRYLGQPLFIKKASPQPEIPDHALAELAMRELKRYLDQPLFITQTGDGAPGRWASDAWIPDKIKIVSNCTDPRTWRCLENPDIPGKANTNHVRLQFFVHKGIRCFSIAQVAAGKIRVSEAVELPPYDPMALCRAVATAKLISAKWSWWPYAASDEDALALEKTLLSRAVDDVLNRIADLLISTNAEAAPPHPDNAAPHPIPP